MSSDSDSLDALRDLLATPSIDDPRLLNQFGIERLRSVHSLMAEWMPRVASMLRAADEAELALARARVAEIEARIGLKPAPPLATSSLPPNDETDAGGGYGEAALEGQTVEAFRDELKSLRAHARAKRLRSQ